MFLIIKKNGDKYGGISKMIEKDGFLIFQAVAEKSGKIRNVQLAKDQVSDIVEYGDEVQEQD